MWIERISFENYRGFAELDLEFKSGFNVIVGRNGSGKTSILKGLVDGLAHIVGNIQEGGPTYLAMANDDVVFTRALQMGSSYRFEKQYPTTITLTAQYELGLFEWKCVKESGRTDHFSVGGSPPFDYYRSMRSSKWDPIKLSGALPIFAFYRAQRAWSTYQQPSEMVAATQRLSRSHGYSEWSDAASGIAGLFAWAISKCLERLEVAVERGISFHDVDDDELALVNEALSLALEGSKGIRYDLKAKTLLVEWLDDSRNATWFEHLSDGQKAVIGLVADIARRISIINPNLGKGATQVTSGVVLIDELDVHLHPSWQRLLPNALKRAFPRMQFITTSHSPQVLGELSVEEIMLLDGRQVFQPRVSYGLDASRVLEEIMGTSARPKYVEELIQRVDEALSENNLELARVTIARLEEVASGIPELTGARAQLRRKELVGR